MRKQYIFITLIVMFVISVSVASYAIFQIDVTDDNQNNLTSTNCIDVNIAGVSGSNAVTLNDTYPLTDEDGMRTKAYDFTVTNTCNLKQEVEIGFAIDNSNSNLFPVNFVKIYFEEEGAPTYLGLITNLNSVVEDEKTVYKIKTLSLKEVESKRFAIRLWVDGSCVKEGDEVNGSCVIDNNTLNKSFTGKISVKHTIKNPSAGVLLTEAEQRTIALSNISPGYQLTRTITVNKSELPSGTNNYKLSLNSTNNTFTSNVLEYSISGVSNGNGTVAKTTYNNPILKGNTMYIGGGSFANGNSNHVYTVKIRYKNEVRDQSDEAGSLFNANIVVEPGQYLYEPAGWSTAPSGTLLYALRNNNIVSVPVTTPGVSASSASEALLASAEDDLGTTYYFRGNVTNNYVNFAGLLWRIVRVNGNGTIRMVSDGTVGYSKWNLSSSDPAYTGYMYDIDQGYFDSSTSYSFKNKNNNDTYYFYKNFNKKNCVLDSATKTGKCTLKGDYIAKNWTNMTQAEALEYKYTCWGKEASTINNETTCPILTEIKTYDATYPKVVYHGYLSKDYAYYTQNNKTSTIKTYLENWYNTTLSSYSSKISDEIFCNDRATFAKTYDGSIYRNRVQVGTDLEKSTYFGARNRMMMSPKQPSYKCLQTNDYFTVSSDKGNGKNIYPVGLLTFDDVIYAGGFQWSINNNLYLNIGKYWWTMTPSILASEFARAFNLGFTSSNNFNEYNLTTNSYVRPVVNLKANVTISSGNGSSASPYVIS